MRGSLSCLRRGQKGPNALSAQSLAFCSLGGTPLTVPVSSTLTPVHVNSPLFPDWVLSCQISTAAKSVASRMRRDSAAGDLGIR